MSTYPFQVCTYIINRNIEVDIKIATLTYFNHDFFILCSYLDDISRNHGHRSSHHFGDFDIFEKTSQNCNRID